MRKDLIKDMVKYSPSQFAVIVAGVISIPVLTRLFPPADYGYYALAMASVSILTTLTGWTGVGVIRFYPIYEKKEQLNTILSTVSWLEIIGTGLVFIAGAGTLILLRGRLAPQLHSMLMIALLVFAITSISTTMKSFLRAKRMAGLYSAFITWNSLGGLLIGIALVLLVGCGIEGMLWGAVISACFAFPMLWKYAIKRPPRLSEFSSDLSAEMARYGLPLVAGGLAAWILSLSDRYIIEFLRGAQEVGIYSASYAVSEKSIGIIITLFLTAAGPLGMNIFENKGHQQAAEFTSFLTRYYLLACIPAVAGISVLAVPFMELLVGPEFREGVRIVPLVAAGAFMRGLQGLFQYGLVFYKKTHYIMVAIVVAGVVNLGLNLLLVPKYGYMAAALTTIVGYTVLLAITVAASRKHFKWKLHFSSLARSAVASAVMAALIYPLGNLINVPVLIRLVLGMAVGIVIYCLVLWLIGEVLPVEKTYMKKFMVRVLPGMIVPERWKEH